jgi:antitoxin MazE
MRVAKWGNSLAVRLPTALVETLALKAGDEVEFWPIPNGAIDVGKVDSRAELLKAMAQFHWLAPEGYRFDREEANER